MLFESKNWWKELVLLIFMAVTIAIIVATIIEVIFNETDGDNVDSSRTVPFDFIYLTVVWPILFLIILIVHKKQFPKKIRNIIYFNPGIGGKNY